MAKDKGVVAGKIGGAAGPVRVTDAERESLTVALDALNDAKEATTRAQIAQATAELDYNKIERTLAKKYKLNTGDGINADGTITRKQG